MHARIGRISFSPDKADEVTRHVEENVVPKYEDTDGFKGFTLLLDRSSGQAIGVTFWESEEAMRATDELGDQGASGRGGGRVGQRPGPAALRGDHRHDGVTGPA